MCAGLGAAHDQGVLHRDLKPANIMIDGLGQARITDFGIAAAIPRPGERTSFAGTPGYIAPELLAGQPPSQRSDIYSLGLVLYEMVTGRRVFTADTFEQRSAEAPAPAARPIRRGLRSCLRVDHHAVPGRGSGSPTAFGLCRGGRTARRGPPGGGTGPGSHALTRHRRRCLGRRGSACPP